MSIIMDVGDHRPGPKGYVGSGRRLRTAEQWINEGKNAVKWTRLSCRSMAANGVRLRLHALAYNLSNFMRTLALPGEVESWSLTTIRKKQVKIGARVAAHARYAVFQMPKWPSRMSCMGVSWP